MCSNVSTYNNARSPWIEQEHGTHEKGAGEHHANEEQQPVAQADILLPEKEWVAVWVAGHTQATVVVADGAHTLNGLHKLGCLAQPVEVEGKLCVFNGLCSRNWGKNDKE